MPEEANPTLAANAEPNPPQENPTQTPPTAPESNTPEARTETGEIKDQAAAPSSTKTEKSDTKADAAPEKYEFKAPDGYEIDQEFVNKATPILKELNISQDGAQKLFDLIQPQLTAAQEEIYSAYDKVRGDWQKAIISDKAIGNGVDGLSAEANQNIAAAINAMPQELRAPFREAMNITGAGDNPAFVKAWNWFGAQLREGKLVVGEKPSPLGQRSPGAGPRSAAAAMFPNLPSSGS